MSWILIRSETRLRLYPSGHLTERKYLRSGGQSGSVDASRHLTERNEAPYSDANEAFASSFAHASERNEAPYSDANEAFASSFAHASERNNLYALKSTKATSNASSVNALYHSS